MTNILNHHSSESTKLLLIGHSGTGKTGALAALATAGYKIRLLDMDNNCGILKDYLSNPKSPYVRQNPACAENLEYRTITDQTKIIGGKVTCAKATAWPTMLSMLNHWKYTDEYGTEIDFGKVSDWGEDVVLVLDTITSATRAALNYHLSMNAALMATRTQNEARRDIGAAQDYMRGLFEMFKDVSIKCNIIAISHIVQVSETGYGPQNDEVIKNDIPVMGFPSSIGRALSPQIPRYFSTVLQATLLGPKHVILTKSLGEVCTKNTAPLKVLPQYPLEYGLLDYFKAVRETSPILKEQKIPLKED